MNLEAALITGIAIVENRFIPDGMGIGLDLYGNTVAMLYFDGRTPSTVLCDRRLEREIHTIAINQKAYKALEDETARRRVNNQSDGG